ncbi:MAG: NUDIX domain-containing protein [Clostridiales bacterium]|nr:NUDIX domain-containing protein [Clostridiales bacterium]
MDKRNSDGLTEKEFLKQYHPGNYERPSVTVDMMVVRMTPDLDKMQILLIQRKNHPYMDCWALAGGFVKMDESAYTAACRELFEETGMKDIYLEQIYTMSQPDRDPRMRVIDIAYAALIPYGKKSEAVAGDDAKAACWFDVEWDEKHLKLSNQEQGIEVEYALQKQVFQNGVIHVENYVPVLVSGEALAFDHAEIILEGLMRLKNKALYSDIAFNLVPGEFTLPDLQKVYEVLLGKELYKTNFRKKIADKIKPLEKKGDSIVGNKKSELYQYR